ncbi:hypothetical protein LOD99_5893 [Oopsacas minuta]|uniref:Uncharacterized protein n=1 Tax=Oopsacas minuta TaxID=111878 RepID=A0AAV7JQ52_9METZ|nr:hypothetical protein LOD99_5893 [Oopsacas minuta]
MVCTFVEFIAFASVLGVCIIINTIFIIVYAIILVCVQTHKSTPVTPIDDLKSVSQSPLLSDKKTPESGLPAPCSGQVFTNVHREQSIVRKQLDRVAMEAIYGADNLELELHRPREIPIGGKISEKANIFENPQISTPTRDVPKLDLEKGKVNELSHKFKSGHNIPIGLQYKQKQVEEAIPEVPEEEKKEKKKAPKPKKVQKAAKDPPSVFKGRHQRDEFLDSEFAELMDQTNKRLAEYTLAGIVEPDVQIFANQHLTQQNIKHSQLEFNKTAFLSKTIDTHSRKLSDQKNMILMAQSVFDDFDYETDEKKASLKSVNSQKTEVTDLSQEYHRK